MHAFTRIFRLARQWRSERRRAAMAARFYDLPIELQKDIGWPAIGEQPPACRG